MENTLSREQLNSLSKDALIDLFLQRQEEMSRKMDVLLEQLAAANNNRFGRKTEVIAEGQLCLFNEAEDLYSTQYEEPAAEEVIGSYRRKKRAGKREEDLAGFPVKRIDHELDEETLKAEFPDGFSRLSDEIYRKLEYHPATQEVLEHHIAVYKGKSSGKIVKAPRPVEMLDKSIATPSLAAAVMNAKYTNALPLYRIEQEFERNDVHISRQVMANWMITLSERYLSLVYDRLKKEILSSSVIHADETPVMVTKDGREGMHKNYMWVYRSGEMCKANAAIIYDYQKTRKQEHPREFLKEYDGTLVCDGYQVYHSLEEDGDGCFKVAGCWAHARRPFSDAVKAVGAGKAKGTMANDALEQIANIYYLDNALKKLPPSERKRKRKLLVKPEVDAFFKWLKDNRNSMLPGSKTGKGFEYCMNQEKYLRTFLTDPQVPLDNNAAERAIRSFCVGKNNWKLIDTENGARASAIIYSIVETAKANDLKIYEYLCFLLTEIPKHMEDHDLDFLEDLLPWATSLPEECRKAQKLN